MGFTSEDQLGDVDYYCEECRPDMHQELLRRVSLNYFQVVFSFIPSSSRKLSKRGRHASANSHHGSVRAPSQSRSPRSHSPVLSRPQKRRNTMNSRDAAYDERMVKALIEATAAEAAPIPPQTPVNANDEPDEESEAVLPNNTRKRKRIDDDRCVGCSAMLDLPDSLLASL